MFAGDELREQPLFNRTHSEKGQPANEGRTQTFACVLAGSSFTGCQSQTTLAKGTSGRHAALKRLSSLPVFPSSSRETPPVLARHQQTLCFFLSLFLKRLLLNGLKTAKHCVLMAHEMADNNIDALFTLRHLPGPISQGSDFSLADSSNISHRHVQPFTV